MDIHIPRVFIVSVKAIDKAKVQPRHEEWFDGCEKRHQPFDAWTGREVRGVPIVRVPHNSISKTTEDLEVLLK
jgi:hypothetical protein